MLKRLLGDIRRADSDYSMIKPGDKIAVGVSGGKDSMLLLKALSVYQRFEEKSFTLYAFTIGTDERFDFSPISNMCFELQIPFELLKTDILNTIIVERKEKNPCSLCAKLRRGALVRLAAENGCNKLALGHNREDALETLLMSVLHEGRLHTIHPVTNLSDNNVTVIRPMIYVPEKHIIHLVSKLGIPIAKNPCPVSGHTERHKMRILLDSLCEKYPRAKEYILDALKNEDQYGLWNRG